MFATPLLAALLLQVGASPQPPALEPAVPLYTNLGGHHYAITATPEAQSYFDQGLRLYYAFNHDEAVRSFREAQRLDPDCAMCWWGEALALGPNINLPMDATAAVPAWAAVQRALAALDGERAVERAFIEALSLRYAATAPTVRAPLDSAYARAMADVARRFPRDAQAAVLHAEAIMDLSPWNYWSASGEPRPGTMDALAHLERVMSEEPRHPGACHFYIHAVEAVYPDRALPCAERLASLMPGAGHLVHMPGHIYIRVGRYDDAIMANEHAVHADETWIRDRRPGMSVYVAGYYPHNYDFLAFAASMAGRRRQAIDAAVRVRDLIHSEMLGAPDLPFLEHWWARPLQIQVRFGLWEEILGEPAPADGLFHARALWHYARGRAFVALGEVSRAGAELEALRRASVHPSLEGVRMEFNASRDILAVAGTVLEGLLADAEGDPELGARLLRRAADLEDDLVYGEPPEWSVPVRHDLGDLLARSGRPVEAERAYREDLDRFRENGWSLRGLERALRQQGRNPEADDVERRLSAAWRNAEGVTPPFRD